MVDSLLLYSFQQSFRTLFKLLLAVFGNPFLGYGSTDVHVPHSESGIVPRSSLIGAGQLGFGEFGKGGTIG